MLRAAGDMRSDYERAEALLALANGRFVDAAIQPAFVEAATAIRSSHEQNRVLAALVRSEQREQPSHNPGATTAATYFTMTRARRRPTPVS